MASGSVRVAPSPQAALDFQGTEVPIPRRSVRPDQSAVRPDLQQPQWTNQFQLTNPEALHLEYRLARIGNLPQSDLYDKQLNNLVKAVAYEVRQPVALVHRDGMPHLAVPAAIESLSPEVALGPDIARIALCEDTHHLRLGELDGVTAPIAIKFLEYALKTPLMRNRRLWTTGRTFYTKQPINGADPRAAIDIYPGFEWHVAMDGEGRLFVRINTKLRYVDRDWFPNRIAETHWNDFRHRHFLYHFGHDWYIVQLRGLALNSIAEQTFRVEEEDRQTDVLSYTRERWAKSPPPWVAELDGAGPAITYRTPGNEKQRYGALALCKLCRTTQDEEVMRLHKQTVEGPAQRFGDYELIATKYFQSAALGGRAIEVSTVPHRVEPRAFSIPALRFGHGRVLGPAGSGASDTMSVHDLGRRRLQMVLDPQAGPLNTEVFDAQYLLVPLSMPRSINEDVQRRFTHEMQGVSGKADYRVQRVIYDDQDARSLHRQVQAITKAIQDNGIARGYVLLMLPERAHPQLHNYIKSHFWPHLQFKCMLSSKVRSYYGLLSGGPDYAAIREREGKLRSYIQNSAFGMMVVNRKWLWALDRPLHYDLYIGIDVLNQRAGFTFVYENGRRIVFQDCPCRQKEKLTSAQMRQVLYERLAQDLPTLGCPPRSIVVHRDGRTFASEMRGVQQAVEALKGEGRLNPDVFVGIVDIRKTAADQVRLAEGSAVSHLQNPLIGSYYVFDRTAGVVCTTGLPFRFPGVAKPLSAVIVASDLNIEWVLEDIFGLSQFVFTAPDKCQRLPLTVKVSDDFLEPIAGEADEDEALYGTDVPEAPENE